MKLLGNTKQRSTVVIGAVLIACAAACSAADSIKVAAAVPVQPIVRDESYRLTAKDLLKITVFHEDDLTSITRIGKDGTISFPLIRTSKIGGRTVREATQILQTQLKEYLVQPEVSISIVEYAKRHITILGQVGRPGTIDMPDDATLNLVEAIGLAGGYTRIANPSRIILKRQVNGQETIFKLDANKMMRDSSTARFEVLPGDTIVVSESLF